MVSNARNDAQVKAMLMPALKDAVDYVVKQILTENEQLIQKIVYDGYTPVEYDRTGQFKKAWDTNTHITGNKVTGEMAYDPDKMTAIGNHHASIVDGQPIQEYLADIIYEGLAGAIYQEGYAKYDKRFKGQAWTKKRDVWNALIKWLGPNRIRKLFEEGMRKQGLNYTRHNYAIFVEKD